MNRLFLLLLVMLNLILIKGCEMDMKSSEVKKIYDNKEYIINEFSNTSIIKSRGHNFVQLTYDHHDTINEYYFENIDDKYTLKNSRINFELNKNRFFEESEINDSNDISFLLYKDLFAKLAIIDSFQIIGITTKFKSMGVNIKIYLKDCSIIYVKNPEKFERKVWIDNFKENNMLDNNWYIFKE